MNAIVTCPEGNKQERLADAYVARIEENNSCVIVSHTVLEFENQSKAFAPYFIFNATIEIGRFPISAIAMRPQFFSLKVTFCAMFTECESRR